MFSNKKMKKKKIIPIIAIILGVIISIGLIVVHNTKRLPPPQSAPFQAIAVKGPEGWIINGKKWKINYTYYIAFKDKSLQYTIDFPCKIKGNKKITQEKALQAVFPLIEYAYRNQLYNRTLIKSNGKTVPVSLIGVCLLEKRGIMVSGFRVNMTLADIRKRINKLSNEIASPNSDSAVAKPE
jgi:hypothetical protein